jgi:hypothetical protein
VAERGDFPAAGAGDFGDEAADAEALEEAADGCPVAGALVGGLVVVLEEALQRGRPEIFNTDQGVQYTSAAFTGRL